MKKTIFMRIIKINKTKVKKKIVLKVKRVHNSKLFCTGIKYNFHISLDLYCIKIVLYLIIHRVVV